MTPSEIVDEVWHQHLTYSRDYWDVWCRESCAAAASRSDAGRAAGASGYRRQYAETLALHERLFGPPSADLWPATHLRFASPRYHVTDRRLWFVAPRPLAVASSSVQRGATIEPVRLARRAVS